MPNRRDHGLFFHAYDHQRPLGGQKHTYAQVDALVAAGFDAWVVHGREGFRLGWFASTTPVIGPLELARRYEVDRDLVVLPEDLGAQLRTIPGRKVIFNKGIYNGFRALELDEPSPYDAPDVVAALAVSPHNAAILRFAYPSLPIHVTRPGLDVSRFPGRPLRDKARRIAWVAKNPSAIAALQHMLAARARGGHNALGSFTWTQIHNLTEQATAAVLEDSLAFVFLGIEEGYGLAPREAALAGCVTVAYDAGTLAGLAPRGLVRPQDVLGIATLLEALAARHPDGLADWQLSVDAARARVVAEAALAAAEAITAWDAILGAARASAP